MAIKTYKQWTSEQDNNRTHEAAYNAGVTEAKKHYEAEFVATSEYFDSVLRRTSDLNFDMVKKVVEIADLVPNIKNELNIPLIQEISNKLQELKDLVRDHDTSL